MSAQRQGRVPVLGPVILIGIGVLALLQNFGYLPSNFWQTVWRLWPLIFILIGVEILINQIRMPWLVSFVLALAVIGLTIGGLVYLAWQSPAETPAASEEAERIEQDLQGATSARVSLDFGAGTMKIGATSGSRLLEGDFLPGARVSYSMSGATGWLTLNVWENNTRFFVSPRRGNEWNLLLSNAIPLDLRVSAGASTNDLDLSDLKLTALRVEAGLSTSTIRLPRQGSYYAAHISGGLATTTVYVPEGVAARIRIEGGLSSTNVDESRFPRSGDTWVSSNYDTAANKVDLHITGGLASVTVR